MNNDIVSFVSDPMRERKTKVPKPDILSGSGGLILLSAKHDLLSANPDLLSAKPDLYPLNLTFYPLNLTFYPLNLTSYPLNLTFSPLILTSTTAPSLRLTVQHPLTLTIPDNLTGVSYKWYASVAGLYSVIDG